MRRNDRLHAFLLVSLDECIAIVALVASRGSRTCGVSCNKASACPTSLAWPTIKIKSNGLLKASVMAQILVVKPPFDLPSASASTLLPAAPAAQACARAIVLSINTCCKSGCWLQPLCKTCHTSLLYHLEKRLKTECHRPSEAGNNLYYEPLRKIQRTAFRKCRQFTAKPA